MYTNTREFANFYDILPGYADSYPQKDALLYFTDNRNEPRKINVYRALMRGFEYAPGNSNTQRNRQIRRDFISACTRVPMAPISFIFEADTDRDVNNFVNVPGFQFAYHTNTHLCSGNACGGRSHNISIAMCAKVTKSICSDALRAC